MLDTDVVIHLRDGSDEIWERTVALNQKLFISAITRVELENGIYRDPAQQLKRRIALDTILEQVDTLDFAAREIAAYCAIVEQVGFSKRKTGDRMSAATAQVHDLTLVTINGQDFQDIPALKLFIWDPPLTPPPS